MGMDFPVSSLEGILREGESTEQAVVRLAQERDGALSYLEELRAQQANDLGFLRETTRSISQDNLAAVEKDVMARALAHLNYTFGFNYSAMFILDTKNQAFVGRYSLGSTEPDEWAAALERISSANGPVLQDAAVEHIQPLDLKIPLNGAGIFSRVYHDRLSYLGQPVEYDAADQQLVDVLGSPFVAIAIKGMEEEVIGIIYGNKVASGEPVVMTMDELRPYDRIRYPTASRLSHIAAMRQIADNERLVNMGMGAGALAHNLRNPMVSIGGFIRRIIGKLSASPDGPQQAPDVAYALDRLAIVLKEAEACETMVRDTLEYARTPLEAYGANPSAFDLVDTLESLAAECAAYVAEQSGKEPRYDVHCARPVQVYADRDMADMHLLRPIITNAFEAMAYPDTTRGVIDGRENVLSLDLDTTETMARLRLLNPQVIPPDILA
ncbi:hypothetical protein COY28_02805, partial [Candidatus Woesearchaeota archaeon CG_4_10_14_0_2_um_filter_57_5]